MTPADELRSAGRRLLLAWGAVTAVGLTTLVFGVVIRGPAFFYAFQGPADATLVEVKFVVFAAAWAWLGLALAATQRPEQLRRDWAFLAVWLLIGLQYLNVVRGPHKVEHKDFSNYFTAARHMRAGLPLTDDPFQLYLYPPLLATLIEPLVPFGLGPASWAFRLANYAALLLFAILLYATLQRFGAGRSLAALLVLAGLVANVPLADTLAAQQINLHVANLVLASLLLHPRRPALSAVALALGAHLKVYPLLLALPFLWRRQWRWCGWFAATLLLVVAATSAVNGFGYYLQFLEQIRSLQEYGIRNASAASLLHNTLRFTGIAFGAAERPLALVLQLALLGLVLRWGGRAMRAGPGVEGTRSTDAAFVVLSLGMLVVSPSIWVHHALLALMPALVIVLWVRRVGDAAALGVAYFLVFLVPVHEVFPFTYLRLAGLLAFAVLAGRATRQGEAGLPPLLQRWIRPATAMATP